VRLAFLGTPATAVTPLQAVAEAGHDVALVVSAADKRRGRGSAVGPSAVKAAAVELGLPVTDRVDDLLALEPPVELGVVVAFGRLIRPHVLAAVPMVNIHFSLLPRWRGAAPVERAILAGDTVTGVDLMAVEEGLDTGGIYDEATLQIQPNETADELRARLTAAGTDMLVELLSRGRPLPEPRPQEGEATYAHKIDASELHVDWSRSSDEIHRLVRIGGAWTTHRGRRLKLWRSHRPTTGAGVEIATGDGRLELLEVQPEGKPRLDAKAWANGARFRDGDHLGD
jgi:methionyl-tRNA formyltransferase